MSRLPASLRYAAMVSDDEQQFVSRDGTSSVGSGSTEPNGYASDEFSQDGEDGILAGIFKLLGVGDGSAWCVEFGAWDGRHLSNTYRLISIAGWRAVLIEADRDRFRDLEKTMQGFPVICLNEMVGFTPPNDLDGLLAPTGISGDFDLLSVDIDGNDYHVWDSLTSFRPKVVVIEYNPTIPGHVEFVQPRDMRVNQGSSLLAMKSLGERKGYELVAVTVTNAIFVREDLYPLIGIADNSLEALWKDRPYQTTLFQLFDGTLVVDGCTHLLWHDFTFRNDALQILPAMIRVYPGFFSSAQVLVWRLWRETIGRRLSSGASTSVDRLLKRLRVRRSAG